MSLAASPIGDGPIAAQSSAAPAKTTRPPRNRQLVAKTDSVSDPEAR